MSPHPDPAIGRVWHNRKGADITERTRLGRAGPRIICTSLEPTTAQVPGSVLGLYGSTQQTACGVGYESAIFNTRTNARISFTFHRGLRVRVHTRTPTWTTLEPAVPYEDPPETTV
jgi:hypothetical protein